jgi:Ca2+-binding EF-hand superfamily protein
MSRQSHCDNLMIVRTLQTIIIFDHRLRQILSSADEDGNGAIEFEEIVSLMERNLKKTTFLDEMRQAFRHFDRDLNGFITPSELKKALGRMDIRLGKVEFLRMLKRVDTDKDGQVSFKEFVVMMLSDAVNI